MSRIRSKDTGPERTVHSILGSLGVAFETHDQCLPGRPDIVLRKKKMVIFVNGCFWHRHRSCKFAYVPKSRVEFWTVKFTDTVRRDNAARRSLQRQGWTVIYIWECQVGNQLKLERRLRSRLSSAAEKQRQGSTNGEAVADECR
jgi:DNA mismatch endonuclease (patch repair protein)